MIFFGADHGGFTCKQELIEKLGGQSSSAAIKDCGAFTLDPTDDYPEFAFAVAKELSQHNSATSLTLDAEPTAWGVLICRSGAGMAIAANRSPGIRAAVCSTREDIDLARRKNNANILVIEGDKIGVDTAWEFLQLFMGTPFDGGRHTKRVLTLG